MRKYGNNAPFLAVSSEAFDESRLREQGFSAYLRKPIDPEQLLDAILAAPARPLANNPAPGPPLYRV